MVNAQQKLTTKSSLGLESIIGSGPRKDCL
jgi:hypothetical protein